MTAPRLWIPLLALIAGTAAAQAQDRKADATLEIDRLKYEFVDGMHKYHHMRRYVVRNDVGVSLNKGKVCYVEQKKCVSAVVKYRIEPGRPLSQPLHMVATRLDEETVTIEYSGRDDAGNDVMLKKTFRLNGDKVVVE